MSRRHAPPHALAVALWMLLVGSAQAAVISDVSAKPSFFNPSIGQKQALRMNVAKPGTVTVSLLDRDRFLIRTLDPLQAKVGILTATWDGKDKSGEVVPDEAYNVKVEFSDGKSSEVYDPSAGFQPEPVDAKINFYSREDGVLSYTLPVASRVHSEAGQSRVDPATKKRTDTILKVLVDSGPRVAGSVIEKWNGLDQGGTIMVPSLPDFVVAVLATPLPPASIIATGNRAQDFPTYALKHRPAQSTRPRDLRESLAKHHSGLTALEDRTPPIALTSAAVWSSEERAWEARLPLTVTAAISGTGAPYFVQQPTTLSVLIDGEEVVQKKQPLNPTDVRLPSERLKPGRHVVAFNWESRLGPVAVNAMEIVVGPETSTGPAKETPK